MARHMRNGRDYSRPGPKVDYELRKDSNNAARSGDVYNKIEEIRSHFMDNGKTFIFGYYNGKFGYYTEESKGADSFVPFSGNPVIEIINSHFETGYKLTKSLTHTVNELEYKAYIAIVATAGGDNTSNANGTATITTTDTSCNITTLFDRAGGWGVPAYSGYGVCQVVLITNIQNGYNITLKGDFKVGGAVSLVLLGIK